MSTAHEVRCMVARRAVDGAPGLHQHVRAHAGRREGAHAAAVRISARSCMTRASPCVWLCGMQEVHRAAQLLDDVPEDARLQRGQLVVADGRAPRRRRVGMARKALVVPIAHGGTQRALECGVSHRCGGAMSSESSRARRRERHLARRRSLHAYPTPPSRRLTASLPRITRSRCRKRFSDSAAGRGGGDKLAVAPAGRRSSRPCTHVRERNTVCSASAGKSVA
jgi:hypothetical protein